MIFNKKKIIEIEKTYLDLNLQKKIQKLKQTKTFKVSKKMGKIF